MTSREVVKRTIHFKDPPRLARNYDSNRNNAEECQFGEDFIWCFLKPVSDLPTHASGRYDEWGVKWQSMGETFGEPVEFPLEGKEEYSDFQFPDYLADWRYDDIRRIVKENNASDDPKYVMAMMPASLFQKMIDLFGFEDFMWQIAGNQEEFVAFLDRLCTYLEKVTQKLCECGVDGIILIEDMGLQDRMMISPAMWQKIYAPLFTRLFSLMHKYGVDAISHTCGHITEILDQYIACGLDVIQQDQQDNMGLEELSKFRGKVCFFCPCDIQTTVDFGREALFKRCDDMLRYLSTPAGGFMAKTYPQPGSIHLTREYMQNMTDGFDAAWRKNYREKVSNP